MDGAEMGIGGVCMKTRWWVYFVHELQIDVGVLLFDIWLPRGLCEFLPENMVLLSSGLFDSCRLEFWFRGSAAMCLLTILYDFLQLLNDTL